VKTAVIVFPFDLFGSSGTSAGAQLLADELREMLADNKRERVPTRARAYARKLKLREFSFARLVDYQKWRPEGRRVARQALDAGDFMLWIAGNHLGVLPVYDELGADSTPTLVVQFDAHLDIHHFTDCAAELSHGNFLRHVASPLPRVLNVGHRELLLRPKDIREFYGDAFAADSIATDPEPALRQARVASRSAKRVFLDIDCDVLDAAFFPAAAQPVPFGLSPSTLLRFIDAAWSPGVAGLAISEFDPSRDQNDRSLATLIWLLEWLLLKLHERGPRRGVRSPKP
jgi:arginase family enzyme